MKDWTREREEKVESTERRNKVIPASAYMCEIHGKEKNEICREGKERKEKPLSKI